MASETPWEDIAEKFCLCAICLEYFEEPKQLACLHRFCKKCLNTLIQEALWTFPCPECREEIELPIEGVDGFKTDFYTRNLVEYIQIKKTLTNDEMRNCYGCGNHLNVAGYCFKCNDFLCANCHTFHMTNNTLKDHRQHTLSIDDIQSKSLTMEKLASFRDAPRCHDHPDKNCELRCETCSNLPVCLSCMFGDHKGHEFHDIKSFAKMEKERLNSKMKQLEEEKEIKLPNSPEEIATRLRLEGKNHKESFQKKCEDEVQSVKSRIRTVNRKKELLQAEKDRIKQTAFASLKKDMDEEIQQIKNKYDQLNKHNEKDIDENFYTREDLIRKELDKLYNELSRFDKLKKDMVESVEMQLNKHLTDIRAVSDHFVNVHERIKNVKVVASSLSESVNDWTASECISDVCNAVDKLIDDIGKFPDLDNMNDKKITCTQVKMLRVLNTTISSEKFKVDLPCIVLGMWVVTDITTIGKGNIFISGVKVLKKQSAIFHVNAGGKLLRQKCFNRKSLTDFRFCDCLSHFKVASVCQPREIGIYDVRNDSYTANDISEISTWPSDQSVSCIATNRLNNDIFVGSCNRRNVYVFDENLTHKNTIIMPEFVLASQNLAVNDTEIMICDPHTKKCHVVSIDGTTNKEAVELTKPEIGKVPLHAKSVCTDSNGFIYLIWASEKVFGRDCHVLAQYSQGDRRLIQAKQLGKAMLDTNPVYLSALQNEKGESLLVATMNSFYGYGLLDSSNAEDTSNTSNQ